MNGFHTNFFAKLYSRCGFVVMFAAAAVFLPVSVRMVRTGRYTVQLADG